MLVRIWKDIQNQLSGKMKIKTRWDTVSYLLRWLKLKGLISWQGCRSTGTLIHVGKSTKQYNNFGEMFGSFLYYF